jgi:hypothetical protein
MQKGVELAKEAVEEDNKQNYPAALELYTRALEYFKTHLKYDKNPKSREMISAKVLVLQCAFAEATSSASLMGVQHLPVSCLLCGLLRGVVRSADGSG